MDPGDERTRRMSGPDKSRGSFLMAPAIPGERKMELHVIIVL